jgi:hypothetical protein
MTVVEPPTETARAHNSTHADDGNGIGLGITGCAAQDPGRNKVSDNEGAAVPEWVVYFDQDPYAEALIRSEAHGL